MLTYLILQSALLTLISVFLSPALHSVIITAISLFLIWKKKSIIASTPTYFPSQYFCVCEFQRLISYNGLLFLERKTRSMERICQDI